jgi:hypothetical protein
MANNFDGQPKIYALEFCDPLKMKRADLCRNTMSALDPQPSIERLKTMARHSNASLREQSSTQRKQQSHMIDAALKRRARRLISNSSIPRQTRNLIRYALEIKDLHLAQVVRRVEAGEMMIDHLLPE